MISSTIKKVLPKSGQSLFEKAYNDSFSRHKDDVLATKVAWGVVKRRFTREEGMWIAMSESFKPVKLFTFKLEAKNEILIQNSKDGSITLDAVLADTSYNTDGYRFNEQSLVSLAKQINNFGSTFPDVEHSTLDSLTEKYGFDFDLLMSKMKQEKGVFTSIKAIVEKGKLWIKAILDKRYKNHVQKFKGLSIEAIANADENFVLNNPKYIGFTFTNNPKLKAARIAA